MLHTPPPQASLPPFSAAFVQSMIQNGQYEQALRHLQPYVATGPPTPEVLDAVSGCYWAMGQTTRALEVLSAMAELWPENPAIWAKRAARHLTLGHKPEAKAGFQRALALQPGHLPILFALNQVERFAPDSAEARQMETRLCDSDISAADRAGLHNALGRILAASAPAQALAHFVSSKALQSGDYDPAATDRKVAILQKAYARPLPLPSAEAQARSPRAVFITGLPRSGTTLLETMLTQHEAVASVGESPALIQSRASLLAAAGLSPDTSDMHETLPAELLAQGRALYFQMNQSRLTQPAPVIIDKLPQNIFELGWAADIMPEARFVFMLRHPLDVGLSLLSNTFHRGHYYARRMEWIGHYIRANYAACDALRSALGPRLRLQSYRALVEQPQSQLSALLDHLSLDWQEACLRPEDNDREVRTASITQVCEGINRSGLDKWRPFEPGLAPMIEALGGWQWIRAWEQRDAEAAAQ
ncbi:sulfotransferase [Phaeobacter sp. HF9A]|uniref:tetratricopeptide repeat-containing sulfotransferase family protein n=1 Tax=Phaeobacter sp. HF9A TaxID=2721561 RepID=UPI00142FD9AA|nr:sulfotransferase [Phaeobacter sp. HF9A]NIZ13634.1 hypothetical protein [Phaeobacter sp. HF9A]